MKKYLALLLVLPLLFSFARAQERENVVQMPYTVQLPDVTREGLYTGETLEGVPHGFGLFTAVNASGVPWHYSGEWENGEMNGQGGQYWDTGKSNVGLYESNAFVCGEEYSMEATRIWIDYRPNEHGHYPCKDYRSDGSLRFEGCITPDTRQYHRGTFYAPNGKTLYTGDAEDMGSSLQTFIDLTGIPYEQLVALRENLNLAMWNCQEWEEVTVPQGVWKVGVDIPAKHWTITASPKAWASIEYGSQLDSSGKGVSAWDSEGYYSEQLYGEKYILSTENSRHSTDIDMKDGYYIVIDGGSVVFTPYAGKPSLGFK